MNELSFGQRIDDNGLIMPWLTHGALDLIYNTELSDKVVFMYGAGLGDAWLAKRCKKLYVVERNAEWLMKASYVCGMNAITNIEYFHRPCNDCSGMDDYYTEIPERIQPDVIIVDDAYRYECIIKSIGYSKSSGKNILLIVDNWQQDYVFICPAAEEALKEYAKVIFVQADHTDHVGRPWTTAIFNLWQ